MYKIFGGFIKKLISKVISGARIPVILLCTQQSNKDIALSPGIYRRIHGATIVLTQGGKSDPKKSDSDNYDNYNDSLFKLVEMLILEIRSELKCKHVLVVDIQVFQSQKKDFQFFSYEPHKNISTVGYFLKRTFREQLGTKLVVKESKVENTLLKHLKKTDSEVHGFQMSFSSKMIDKKELGSQPKKSNFSFALMASIYAAMTKMRIDSGEMKI